MKLLRELNEPNIDLTQALNEAIKELDIEDNVAGKLVTGAHTKTTNALIKNPKIAVNSMKQALTAYDMYVKNNRYTAQLFAKTQNERTLYDAIVKDLVKTGKYKLQKNSYVGNGWIWVLRRNSL